MKRQETPPVALRQAVRFDTLSVKVCDEVRQSSPTLGRSQAQYVRAAVLRHLYPASGGHLATAEVSLDQGALAQEVDLSRQWLGVLLTRLQDAGWIVSEGAGGATTRLRAGPQLLQVERLLREEMQVGTHRRILR
jgi:hypothetical protein